MKSVVTLRKTAQRAGSALQEDLMKMIRRGSLPPGGALKSERHLAKEYAISRVTVRRVLESLIEQGLLCRRYPVGTFVAKPANRDGRPSNDRSRPNRTEEKPLWNPYVSLGSACTLRFRISEPLRYQRQIWNQIIAEFHRQYPHINIEPVYAGLGSTEPPDILQVTNFSLGKELEIIGTVGEVNVPVVEAQDFHPLASPVLTSPGALRGLPFAIAVLCLFSNERMFRDCGVEPPDPVEPLRVADYLERAVALAEAARKKSGTDAWGSIHFGFVGLLMAMGIPVYDEKKRTFEFGSAAFQEAATRILAASRKAAPAAEPSYTVFHRLFREARVGTMVRGTYELPMYQGFSGCRISPAPIDSGGVYWGALLINCVAGTSRHPEEGWEFVRFLSSPAAQQIYASGGFNLPVRLEAQETYFREHAAQYGFLREALSRTRVFHGGIWAMDCFLSTVVEGEFWATLTKDQPLEVTLQKIQRTGQRFLAQQTPGKKDP